MEQRSNPAWLARRYHLAALHTEADNALTFGDWAYLVAVQEAIELQTTGARWWLAEPFRQLPDEVVLRATDTDTIEDLERQRAQAAAAANRTNYYLAARALKLRKEAPRELGHIRKKGGTVKRSNV